MIRSTAPLFALCLLLSAVTACTDDADGDGAGGTGGAGGSDAGDGGPGGSGGEGGTGGMGGTGGVGASCMADDGCPPGARCDTTQGTCRPACGDDRDCGPSARCTANGFCADLPPCAGPDDCGAGTVCDCNGVCAPAPGDPCVRDLQCDTADYCDACTGTCKPRAAQCGRCDDGSGCDPRANCHPVGAEGLGYCLQRCQGSCARFGPGYECLPVDDETSLCVPITRQCDALAECAADGDCPGGRICNDGFCQPGCTADANCTVGEICQAGRCGPPCAGDGDCEGEAVCEPDGRCRVPGGCQTSADCPQPQTFCDRNAGMCVPGCEVDDDCQDATLQCSGGECVRRGCTAAFQCSFGEVCDLETNQCEMAEGRHCEPGCDPMDENSCGGEGRRCLSLQDEDENPLGDFCFEPCAEPPNACPQGYQCVELMDQEGNPMGDICIRRCDLDPFR